MGGKGSPNGGLVGDSCGEAGLSCSESIRSDNMKSPRKGPLWAVTGEMKSPRRAAPGTPRSMVAALQQSEASPASPGAVSHEQHVHQFLAEAGASSAAGASIVGSKFTKIASPQKRTDASAAFAAALEQHAGAPGSKDRTASHTEGWASHRGSREKEQQPYASSCSTTSSECSPKNWTKFSAATPSCSSSASRDVKACCPRGHRLSMFTTWDERFLCSVCSRRQAMGTSMYGCRLCDYDRCASCIGNAVALPQPEAEVAARLPRPSVAVHCPKGHPLKHIDAWTHGSCDSCSSKVSTGEDIMVCEGCDWTWWLCRQCQRPTATGSQTPRGGALATFLGPATPRGGSKERAPLMSQRTPRSARDNSAVANCPGALTPGEKPRCYVVTFGAGMPVNESIRRDSATITTLPVGACVQVLAVDPVPRDGRFRARIRDPPGFVSMCSEDGENWFLQPVKETSNGVLSNKAADTQRADFNAAPGSYVVIYDCGMPVNEGPRRDTPSITLLPQGAKVQVVEVDPVPREGRLRARILEPPGYVSMCTDDREIWFIKRVSANPFDSDSGGDSPGVAGSGLHNRARVREAPSKAAAGRTTDGSSSVLAGSLSARGPRSIPARGGPGSSSARGFHDPRSTGGAPKQGGGVAFLAPKGLEPAQPSLGAASGGLDFKLNLPGRPIGRPNLGVCTERSDDPFAPSASICGGAATERGHAALTHLNARDYGNGVDNVGPLCGGASKNRGHAALAHLVGVIVEEEGSGRSIQEDPFVNPNASSGVSVGSRLDAWGLQRSTGGDDVKALRGAGHADGVFGVGDPNDFRTFPPVLGAVARGGFQAQSKSAAVPNGCDDYEQDLPDSVPFGAEESELLSSALRPMEEFAFASSPWFQTPRNA